MSYSAKSMYRWSSELRVKYISFSGALGVDSDVSVHGRFASQAESSAVH